MKLDKEIKEKLPELATRKGVIFYQDNARRHTSLDPRKKLLKYFKTLKTHCINCYSLETIFFNDREKIFDDREMTENYFRR